MNPVYLLAGPPAVGKTTTARALAARFAQSIHIPVDDLRDMVVSGRVYPGEAWPPELVAQLQLARHSAVQMAQAYRAAGFMVVIDDFWDPHSRLQEYAALTAEANVHRVLLLPSRAVAEARNLQRSGPGPASAFIQQGIQAVYAGLDEVGAALTQTGWRRLDTSHRSPKETVDAILAGSP